VLARGTPSREAATVRAQAVVPFGLLRTMAAEAEKAAAAEAAEAKPMPQPNRVLPFRAAPPAPHDPGSYLPPRQPDPVSHLPPRPPFPSTLPYDPPRGN
jgi:hypothetical protein